MRRYLLAAAIATCIAAAAVPGVEQHAEAATTGITVAVVGDMACDTSDPHYNGGKGTSSDCKEMAVSSSILAASPKAVIGVGDFQYDCGDPDDYQASYDPSFGRLDDIMDPTPGNHEYKTGKDVYGDACPSSNSTAAGYFNHFGSRSHPTTSGWYSFDLGSWHLISLNANCNRIGGCGATSKETTWLKNDLDNTSQPCIAAFWHQPLYTGQGNGYNSAYKAWWDVLYADHADLVLNGHVHNYQRFPAMNASKTRTSAGITEYVVGTGGENQSSVGSSVTPHPTYWKKAFGYLRLTLTNTGWTSKFITIDGAALDGYSGTCHS